MWRAVHDSPEGGEGGGGRAGSALAPPMPRSDTNGGPRVVCAGWGFPEQRAHGCPLVVDCRVAHLGLALPSGSPSPRLVFGVAALPTIHCVTPTSVYNLHGEWKMRDQDAEMHGAGIMWWQGAWWVACWVGHPLMKRKYIGLPCTAAETDHHTATHFVSV